MIVIRIRRVSAIQVVVAAVILAGSAVFADDNMPIPADRSQLEKWFKDNVKPLSEQKGTIAPELAKAEEGQPKIVKVSPDGKGDFKTITEAINSIPSGNTKRVIVSIASGTYYEKIRINRTKPFVTLIGDANNMPNITFNGTAKIFGTVDSATLIAEGGYFVAANLIIQNNAPMPDGKMVGAQAVALRLSGDNSVLYNCKLFGYQDTVCDDKGHHLFKDCTIQGTVDFIFGSGKSMYLNTSLVVVGSGAGVIAAQARQKDTEDIGYSFVHCDIKGTASGTFLGRAWMTHGKVVYAYTTMTKIVNPLGWNIDKHPQNAKTVFFGEYKNSGDSGTPKGRAGFTKQLSEAEAKPFLSLGFIQASKWLLPLPKV